MDLANDHWVAASLDEDRRGSSRGDVDQVDSEPLQLMAKHLFGPINASERRWADRLGAGGLGETLAAMVE